MIYKKENKNLKGKNMKKSLKIISAIIIMIALTLINMPRVSARQVEGTDSSGSSSSSSSSSSTSSGSLSWSSIIQKGKNFISSGNSEQKINQSQVENDLLPLARILMGIAILVLLIVGAILGVKYMISGADEKANIKEKLIWYVVALVLIFGAVGIYNIVAKIMNNVMS